MLIQFILSVATSFLFGGILYELTLKGFNPFFYLFSVFMYLWVSVFLSYALFVSICGVAGTVYFLEGTECMPQNPVWDSFVRAIGHSGGSSACASFIVAVIEFLKFIVQSLNKNDNVLVAIISLIALCLLSILECIFKFISHYGLIYCSLFGVPFFEGSRRFLELNHKKLLLFCLVVLL